jgi:DNA-binding NarL/FixJ family response regulator
MLKVILVDDHQIVRRGIKLLLEEPSGEMQVVAEAASAPELFQVLEETEANVVLLDLNLPGGMDGLEAISYLKGHYPDLKILILSMMDQEKYVAQAVAAGADGYLSKTSNQEELLQALELVGKGNKYITPRITLKLLTKEPETPAPAEKSEVLSKRELEILKLIAEGYTAEKIADKTFTSRRTVETHRQNILEKTKTKNTANLVLYAIRHHLID